METQAAGNTLDLSSFDTKSAAEAGTVVHLENPRTNEPLYDANGAAVTITIVGQDAERIGKMVRRNADRRFERLRKGQSSDVDSATLLTENVELLAAATIAWNMLPVDGQVLECNEKNARKLYGDARFPWIREQVEKVFGDRKRFFTSTSAN